MLVHGFCLLGQPRLELIGVSSARSGGSFRSKARRSGSLSVLLAVSGKSVDSRLFGSDASGSKYCSLIVRYSLSASCIERQAFSVCHLES